MQPSTESEGAINAALLDGIMEHMRPHAALLLQPPVSVTTLHPSRHPGDQGSRRASSPRLGRREEDLTKEKEDMTKEKEDMTNGKEDMTKKKDKKELATPGWRVTEPPEDSGLLQQGRVMRSATAGVEDTSDWHYRVMHRIMERRLANRALAGWLAGWR